MLPTRRALRKVSGRWRTSDHDRELCGIARYCFAIATAAVSGEDEASVVFCDFIMRAEIRSGPERRSEKVQRELRRRAARSKFVPIAGSFDAAHHRVVASCASTLRTIPDCRERANGYPQRNSKAATGLPEFSRRLFVSSKSVDSECHTTARHRRGVPVPRFSNR